jgi:hypothetical protein
MADQSSSSESETPPHHRGRIQAQGGGTEESEAWAQSSPPTLSELLRLIDRLEARLTPRERRIRAKGFAQLRRYVENAARFGGVDAPVPKSFPNPPTGDVRVDLEVISGKAGVPEDPPRIEQVEN